MSVDYSAIGRRVKVRRKELNKTQEDLAEALSVSVGYISQIERGVTRVNLDTLASIAVELDCRLEHLVSGVSGRQEHYLDAELATVCAGMNSRQKQMLLEIATIISKG